MSVSKNYFRALCFAFLLACTGVLSIQAQDKSVGNTIMTSSMPESEVIVSTVPMTSTNAVVGPVQYMEVPVSSGGCNCCDPQPQRHHTTLRENLSATACFNCRTDGSYKFPVPRHYTYFWPGIYSQKTMTEYVAPQDGLKLRSPSEVFDDSEESEK